jgi:prepilin-type N-terminal cleavage/methylation domain-containing protein
MRRLGQNIEFTLIELLVVISIIVILMSLLLPAISKVKDKTKEITCVSNIKQLSVGFSLYFGDHQDYIIPYWSNGTNTQTGSKGWYTVIEEQNYVPKRQLRYCPAHENPGVVTGSYGLNNHISGRKLTQFGRCHETGLLCDTISSVLNYCSTSMDFRHSKRIEVLFLDLHIGAMTFEDVPVIVSSGHGYFWYGVE